MSATAETPTPDVVGALSQLIAVLPGIGKGEESEALGYSFRGIEQMTRTVQPLLAKHGIVFVPQVKHYEVVNITVNSRPWTDTRLLVAYRIFGPRGAQDYIDAGPFLAIARDRDDKGANKALTQAFKQCLLQVLCISDKKDDGDSQSHEADSQSHEADGDAEPPLPEGWENHEQCRREHRQVQERVQALTDAQREWFTGHRERFGWPMAVEPFEEMERQLVEIEEPQTAQTQEGATDAEAV